MERSTNASRRSARQSGDKIRSTVSNPAVINLVELSSDSMEKKLDDFLSKVKDENAREGCFKKLDDHVNGLLDAVKIREKKRKSKWRSMACLNNCSSDCN